MTPKLLLFAVALVAVATVAVVAMEIAVLSQLQQDADAKGCRTSQAVNASKGRCISWTYKPRMPMPVAQQPMRKRNRITTTTTRSKNIVNH